MPRRILGGSLVDRIILIESEGVIIIIVRTVVVVVIIRNAYYNKCFNCVCRVPDGVLRALRMSSGFNLYHLPLRVGLMIILISQRRKMGHRKLKSWAHGHKAN